MDVTDVRIRMSSEKGRMKAIVSVVFFNSFVVHDVRIIEGKKGLFLAMPSKRITNGEFKDIVHPINLETRTIIEKAVLEAYNRESTRLSKASTGL